MHDMLSILKNLLLPGMEVKNEKELHSKFVFSFCYDGSELKKQELLKVCGPGMEEKYCRDVINTMMAAILVEQGKLEQGKDWLNGIPWVRENPKAQEGEVDQRKVIEDYLEYSYSGAKMMDDAVTMLRIARALAAFRADPYEDIFKEEFLPE